MKQISKEEIKKLVDSKYIFNSPKGFIDKRGYAVGFYRTRNKRYIEDKYVNIARKLEQRKVDK